MLPEDSMTETAAPAETSGVGEGHLNGVTEQIEAGQQQSDATHEQATASTSFVPSLTKEEEARLLKVCFSWTIPQSS